MTAGRRQGRPGHLALVDLDSWFADDGRDLPWRHSRDPWAIVVAEMMLQQTQVARVIERWTPFLERFPTAAVCAAGPAGAVIDEWSGLGYNRRAVYLHRLAVVVGEQYGGSLPESLGELLALPGIGPYTARAIRVFAFEQPEAVLDTNVARILARSAGRTLARPEAQQMADDNLGHNPWVWNQAMLDVGARFCTAKNPTCGGCPIEPACAWRSVGRPDPDPAVGSAAVSGKQSRFTGSDRQGRGRLVRALRSGPVGTEQLAAVMGWPSDPERAVRIAETLVTDGLAEQTSDGLILPGS